MGVGIHLKRIRTNANKSANSFAKQIGVDVERYRKWEQKDMSPREDDAEIVKSFFGVDNLEQLAGINEVPKSSKPYLEAEKVLPAPNMSQNDTYKDKLIALLEERVDDYKNKISGLENKIDRQERNISEILAVVKDLQSVKMIAADNATNLDELRKNQQTMLNYQLAFQEVVITRLTETPAQAQALSRTVGKSFARKNLEKQS